MAFGIAVGMRLSSRQWELIRHFSPQPKRRRDGCGGPGAEELLEIISYERASPLMPGLGKFMSNPRSARPAATHRAPVSRSQSLELFFRSIYLVLDFLTNPHVIYDVEVGVGRRRWLRVLAILVLVSAVAAGVPSIRRRILRSAGWALVLHDKPPESADIIVVVPHADGAGALEAADLVHSGVATRVAVFADSPNDVVDAEFIRRGISFEDAAARSARQLRSLGVEAIEQIPRTVAGSEDEGQVLPEWCDQRGLRSIVVVTTSDHSRRLWRILHRSMKGHRTRVAIWPARYSTFDPDRWWETHDGIRTEMVEFEKLLLDVARHPIG